MAYQYYINFKDKTEYVKHENRFLRYPIGSLLFAVMDTEWDALAEEISDYRRNLYRMDQVQESVQSISKRFDDTHVFLKRDFERLSRSGDVLYAAYYRAMDYARLRQELSRLIRSVLDIDGENADLTVLQRYFLLNATDPETRRFKQRMHEQLKVFQCMMCGEDEASLQIDKRLVRELSLEAAICYASDDLRTLVFMEFEYMVTEGYAVRRCDNCGKYFLPFSVVSRYCDRLYSGQKTCKDFAVRERYNQKLAGNELRALYVKNNNAYQMRVRRAPSLYSAEDYAAWKLAAKQALSEEESGSLSEAMCRRLLALPKKK